MPQQLLLRKKKRMERARDFYKLSFNDSGKAVWVVGRGSRRQGLVGRMVAGSSNSVVSRAWHM